MEEKIPLLAALERADGAAPNGSAPAWLARLREESAARFRETGLPTTRLEGWRRTSLAPMADVPFGPVGHGAATDLAVAPFLFGKFDAWRIVFVDGRFAPEHSSLDGLPAGVRVESLSVALAERPTLVEPHLGRIARWKDEPMVALNTAFASEGAFVSLADRVVLDRPVHVAFLSTANGEPAAVQPRLLVVLGAAAQMRLTEGWGGLGSGRTLTNAVAEIAVGDGATLFHDRVQQEGEGTTHLAHTQVRVGRDGHYNSRSISMGGSLVRNELSVELAGEGASTRLDGLYFASGSRHVDHQTFVDHAVSHGSSTQLYKGVLDGASTAVFNGRVMVRKDAQKTDSRQTNRNLLLSDDATVDTKPQLEILADDVKCSHGATIGQIDETSLFYLRSRGIGEAEARELLVWAFASEILDGVKEEAVRRGIAKQLLGRLPIDLSLDEVRG